MIDRALGLNTSESYYFQLYPVNLHLVKGDLPSKQAKFKFSIYKNQQKFDENKIFTDSEFIQVGEQHIMTFRGCQLNFYLPNFTVGRTIQFTLKLAMNDNNDDYEVGQLKINPANYIKQFKSKQATRFQQKLEISEDFLLDFEIYVEKSRFALQKNVKDHKNQRTMRSPARQHISQISNSDLSQKKSFRSVSPIRSPVKQIPLNEQTEVKQQAPKVKGTFVASNMASPSKQFRIQNVQEKSIQRSPQHELKFQNPKTEKAEKPQRKVEKVQRSENKVLSSTKKLSQSHQSPKKENVSKILSHSSTQVSTSRPINWAMIGVLIIGFALIYLVMHPTKRT